MTPPDDSVSIARRRLAAQLGRVAAGERTAFKELYSLTSAKLFGICLRISSDRNDAEEALQDTFTTIWQRASAFDATRGSPIAWLAAIARNRAIDRLRARRDRGQAPIELADTIADSSVPADVAIEQDQDAQRLDGCLATLAGDDAGLIRTAFLTGSSYSELASKTGQPLGTIKSRIRRALMKLKLCLTQ